MRNITKFHHTCGKANPSRMYAIMISLCALSLVSAAPPATGLEGLGRELSNEELSEMRGRFVRANSIHFFGVELVQSWRRADGVTVFAQLLFNVDFAGGAGKLKDATPTIEISWDRRCTGCADPTMDIPSFHSDGVADSGADTPAALLSVGRFESLEGLVQTQEIAGSNNSVLNTLHVSVVPNASMQRLDTEATNSITSSEYLVTDEGERIDFEVARNQLGISIVRGNESIGQGVNGELNQAAQHVVLQSSSNVVRNDMAITVGIEGLRHLQRHNIQSALSVMKGRGM